MITQIVAVNLISKLTMILESTSDKSNTLCTDSDYEAGLTVDVSTSSSSEGSTVSDESDNSSDNNKGADDDSEQT